MSLKFLSGQGIDGSVGIGTNVPTSTLTVSSSVGGDGSWNKSGILIENTSTTTGEPTLAFRNAGTSGTGANYWHTGLNQSNTYKIAYGTSFTDGNTKFELATNGALRLNSYTQGFLQTDANGNVSLSGGGTLPGGPYVTINTDQSITSTKTFDANQIFGNNIELRWLDSGATERTVLELDSNDDLYLGKSGGGKLFLVNGASYTTAVTIDDAQNVGIGIASPTKTLNVEFDSSSVAVNTGEGLGGGTAGTGVLLRNSNETVGTFANLDFRANNVDARIAVTHNATNNGDFHFILDNTTATPLTRLFIEGETGNVGIGTDSPDQKLQVEFANSDTSFSGGSGGDWGSKGIRIENTLNTVDTMAMLHLRNNDADVHIASIRQGSNDSDLGFFFEGAEKVRFTNNGNVGIGTTDPDYLLDLYKSTSTTSSTTGTTLQRLWNYVGSDLNQQKTFIDFVFQDDNDNEYPQVRIGAEVGQNGDAGTQIKEGSGAFVVYTNNATGTGPGTPTGLAERFRVDYQGNVGIGTTSPGAKLNVAGDILINSGEYISWGTVGATSIEGSTASNKLQFRTNSSDRMIIDSTGNVGINTTLPDFKLDIDGTFGVSDLPFNTDSVSVLVADETLGPELVTNGNFATDADWVKGTGWTISGGSASKSTGSQSDLDQYTVTTLGDSYKVELTVYGVTAGSISVRLGTSASNAIGSIDANGTYAFYGTVAGDLRLRIRANATFVGSIDDVSVKQVTSASDQIQKRELGTDAFISDGPYLPLTGGTLTGGLIGTTGVFSDDVSALRFDMNPGYAASAEYMSISKAQNQDGGILLKSKVTGGAGQLDWQILNHGTTGDLRFYAYGLGGNSLILNKANGDATFGGNIYLQDTVNPTIFFNGSSDATIDFAIKSTPEGLDFIEPEQSDKIHFQILDDTGVNAVFGYRLAGTMVIDTSRNLLNMGTGGFSGTVTAPVFSGNLQGGHTTGTISSGVTGTTQPNATDNTELATTAFVVNKIAELPAGLQFLGTWNAATNDPTLASGGGEISEGTVTTVTADKLIDSAATFTTAPLVAIGDRVRVVTPSGPEFALVTAIDSATQLTLAADIVTATGEAYIIEKPAFIPEGNYYIVSDNGATDLNGITEWKVGDWVVASSTNVWQKIINSSVLDGTGTGQTLPLWSGSGTSNTLTDSVVTQDSTNIGIGIAIPLHKLDIESDDNSLLKIRNTTNAGGASIEFNDNGTAATTQNGQITYYHSDSASQGGGASFWFEAQPDTTLVVGNGTNTGRVVVGGNSATEVGYGFYDDINTGMFKPTNHQLGFATNGTNRLTIASSAVDFAVPIKTIIGTAAIPALQIGDTDSGFYDSGANLISVSLGGVQSATFHDGGRFQAVSSIQAGDDTNTAGASRVGAMRYRTGTEYVEVTGAELIPQPLDFTDGWDSIGSTTTITADTFVTVTSAGGVRIANLLTVGQVYRMVISGTTTTTSNQINNYANNSNYKTWSGTGAFDFTFTFTATTDSGLYLRLWPGTAEIYNLSVMEVTEEDASYADMCMQTGASEYEWVNIVRNTY